jgi:protein-tyrosine phosphatase
MTFFMRSGLKKVSVVRTAPSAVRIAWGASSDVGCIEVYGGRTPETIDRRRPLAVAERQNRVDVTGLEPGRRHYFELVPDRGERQVTAERRLPFEGAFNFRDLGGYRTRDGARIRWGQLFRSDSLARLTKADLAYLRRMHLRLVCDLRTANEVKRSPNLFPDSESVAHIRLAMRQGRLDPIDAYERLQQGDASWLSEDYMLQGYRWNSEKYAAAWKRFFHLLIEPGNRPAVFHCTAGKDRTGVGAALLMLALGVPEEAVIADYGASDGHLAPVMDTVRETIQSYGISLQDVQPWLTAPPSRILAFLELLHQAYGSPLEYLRRRVKLTDDFLEQLRTQLLE